PGHWLMHCHMTFHMMQPESLPGYFVSTAYSAHNAGMGGLVLGLDVLPSAKTEATQRSPRPPVHTFRLDVRERPASRLAFAGYSYVVSESGHEPPADTLPPIGAPLVLTRGEPAEIEIFNRLNEPTTVHWHGIELESAYDGVPDWSGSSTETTPPIAPGASFVARMTPPRAGTFINITPVDSDLTYSLKDASGAALEWSVIAKDGRDLPPSQVVIKDATGDSITVGETRDYSFTPQKTGELYLEAAAFQRMWVKVTLVVTRSALQPTATLRDEADGQITAYDRGDFCRQSRAQENKTQSSLLPDFYRICLIGNIQRRFYSRSGAAP
ncbi:MAG TPA: multicopper oxidase domain-containing protein, partial [Terriglobales bacterium]|nr:multicopper oxidase domain-containing protein [Terriglobales bacterium]